MTIRWEAIGGSRYAYGDVPRAIHDALAESEASGSLDTGEAVELLQAAEEALRHAFCALSEIVAEAGHDTDGDTTGQSLARCILDRYDQP